MSPPLAKVIAALEAHGCRRETSGDWTCPTHEDRTPSLSVSEARDGRALLHCHAGCEIASVTAALGLDMSDLFPEPTSKNGRPEIVATYEYLDEAGELLFQVVRHDPKDFRQRRPDGAGGWIWQLGDARRVLYRLPQVIEAVAVGDTVYVCEGEKDVEALKAAGAIATCNAGGAGKWRSEYAEHLRGAEVVVVADRDEAGRKHATTVAASLVGIAASVQVVEAAEGKDAADHLAADRGLDEFVPVKPTPAETHPWEPVADWSAALDPPPAPSILRAEKEGALLYEGARHVLGGEYESLKSWMAAAAAVDLIKDGRDVWWLDADRMGQSALLERLMALGATLVEVEAHVLYVAPNQPVDGEAREIIVRTIAEHVIALAVIDAFDPALELQECDPNSTRDVQRFYRELVEIFHEAGIATLLPDHVAKDPEKRGRYSIGSQRKATAADVLLVAELVGEKMTRSSPRGRAVLRALKDRPAWHDRGPGQRIGEVAFDLADRDRPVRLTLARGGEDQRGGRRFRPTVLMERVSRHLEAMALAVAPHPSQRQIEADVTGKADGIRKALQVLVDEGYVVIERDGQATRYTSRRAYRESDDHLDERGLERGSKRQPSPERVPEDAVRRVPARPQPRPGQNAPEQQDSPAASQRVPPRLLPGAATASPEGAPPTGGVPQSGTRLKEGDDPVETTDSKPRCGTCGKRTWRSEPGESVCFCDETAETDWRALLPEEEGTAS